MTLRRTLQDREFDKFTTDADGNTVIRTTAVLETGDIEIGAVELKNATTDDRLIVTSSGSARVLNKQIAETTVPTAVADGAEVNLNVDEYGAQRLAGYNYSVNSIDSNVVNQALLNTITVTNLSAVTATGAGTAIDMSNFNKITVQYTASSVTTGGTVKLQGSIGGTNWYDLDTESITANGTTYGSVNGKHKFVRTNVTTRTDGTYTTIIFGGN